MPSSWQSLVNWRATSVAQALLDVVQDLLVAALVADQQQRGRPFSFSTSSTVLRHVGLGVAAPRDREARLAEAELAELARQLHRRARALSVSVSSSKKISLVCGHLLEDVLHLLDHLGDRAVAVVVPADRLRPQAEGAAALAAAPGVEADIGVAQVAAEIFLDGRGRACRSARPSAARPCPRSARGPCCARTRRRARAR